ICNIALVIGLSAAYAGVNCHWSKIKQEGLLMIVITISLIIFSAKFGEISRIVGVVYLICFAGFIYWMFNSKNPEVIDEDDIDDNTASLSKMLIVIAISIAILIFSSDLLVDAVVDLATAIGVSQ